MRFRRVIYLIYVVIGGWGVCGECFVLFDIFDVWKVSVIVKFGIGVIINVVLCVELMLKIFVWFLFFVSDDLLLRLLNEIVLLLKLIWFFCVSDVYLIVLRIVYCVFLCVCVCGEVEVNVGLIYFNRR